MLGFVARNWILILFIGGMLVMHLRHGAGGHGGGCGAGHGGHQHRDDQENDLREPRHHGRNGASAEVVDWQSADEQSGSRSATGRRGP